ALDLLRPLISALGQKQTLKSLDPMSALPPKADIETQPRNVRFVPKADSAAKPGYIFVVAPLDLRGLSATSDWKIIARQCGPNPGSGRSLDHVPVPMGQLRNSGARSVIALTTALAWKPNSSGTSAALRWIQNVFNPADAAPLISQEFAEMKPSSGLLTFMRSEARL